MPKGRTLCKKGGDFMEAELTCGFICQGAQQSVKKRIQLHKRLCNMCVNNTEITVIGTADVTKDNEWRNGKQWCSSLGHTLKKQLK
jgi:hypothetical protein